MSRVVGHSTKRFALAQIAAGDDFSLTLLENGKVYAWGRNVHSQHGTGHRSTSSVPRQVQGLSDIVAITAGAFHALALTSGGAVNSWSHNQSGQLGIGS
jgi:alpha-tubulin suppressor-like RCC1 family protein